MYFLLRPTQLCRLELFSLQHIVVQIKVKYDFKWVCFLDLYCLHKVFISSRCRQRSSLYFCCALDSRDWMYIVHFGNSSSQLLAFSMLVFISGSPPKCHLVESSTISKWGLWFQRMFTKSRKEQASIWTHRVFFKHLQMKCTARSGHYSAETCSAFSSSASHPIFDRSNSFYRIK